MNSITIVQLSFMCFSKFLGVKLGIQKSFLFIIDDKYEVNLYLYKFFAPFDIAEAPGAEFKCYVMLLM